jgi:DNA-binding transcriptional ArsR family regulator
MSDAPDIADVAALLAHPARAAMAWALVDGSSLPAGALAAHGNVSPQSASRHLALLRRGGLLDVEALGRLRAYRLANSEVACMVESMASLAAELAADRSCSLAARDATAAFRQARTCYDHFSGRFGVDLYDGMRAAGWLAGEPDRLVLTGGGEAALVRLGVDLAKARCEHRVFARACADLTERRPHLGGALAAALLDAFLARGFVLRTRQARVVTVTPTGWEALRAAKLIAPL